MNDPQKEVATMLESKGYVLERDCIWPIYCHPETGCRIQIDYTGRQLNVGYRKTDPKLQQLYVELDAVEASLDRAMFRTEWASLDKRRAELLGDIKKREKELN